ncbi:MAG: transporter ATP-binding protein [Solirubrobacterales bacterium]|nr:transporter ATP-binding protein [Solirubrobacterales bacterium]
MSGVVVSREAVSEPLAPAALDVPMPMRLKGVTKQWENQQPVLDSVDLDLDIGTTTRIAGRNGAGKTTLMRIAAGLIEPGQGRAEVWGLTPAEGRERYQRLVSFLPAGDRGLYARLSVRRQLEFWARIALIPRRQVKPRVEEALETFALGDLSSRRVDRMSMGQRQRVRISMTFLAEPEIVLLDEPLTSLDEEGSAILFGAIERLLGSGGAVLWCSPAGERIDYSFDRTLALEGGRLEPA